MLSKTDKNGHRKNTEVILSGSP